jgi:hypothetical protein
MFNALRTDELIVGMGRTMRAAAAAEGPADDYARGQLLSAYSVSRLLAAEVRAEAELLAWMKGEIRAALAAGEEEAALAATADDALAIARERLDDADSIELGGILVDLLADLRVRAPDSELRRRLHAILREMAVREIAALDARPDRAPAPRG